MREGKYFAQTSTRITGRRKGRAPGAVITAVVAADMVWMIVCFWRKQWAFECSRLVSAIGPFPPHSHERGESRTSLKVLQAEGYAGE